MSFRENEDRERDHHIEDTLQRILELEETNHQLLKEITMSQADIDAAVAALQADETGLDASVARIQAWIDAHPNEDTSALVAEVANLQSHVDNVNALAPSAPPAP